MDFNLHIVNQWDGILACPDHAFSDLDRVITGETIPNFPRAGRTSEIILTEPLETKAGAVHCLKIKSIGLQDHI